ncbi:lipopolysaccharide-induced tumor necrosis factor-alpha factor homolog isoform X2 [Drosophila biarmipes]|nr:lipopolysaccharide-induced tumor necrosis factor-alpha factor homolog isoform X2 [Drosophila biarmipes]
MATCPNCGVRRQTVVDYEPSNKTHLIALFICCLGGVCCWCIPYCNDSCQSANHKCKACGAYVGTFKN